MEQILKLFIISEGVFIGILFLMMSYIHMKVKKIPKKDDFGLKDFSKEIIEEMDRNTEKNIAKFENAQKELDFKLNEIQKLENNVKELLQEKKIKEQISRINIEPRKNNAENENRKNEIKKLYELGYEIEEIAKKLSLHKGFVETIVSLENVKNKVR